MRRLERHGVYSPTLGRVRGARLVDLLLNGVRWLWPVQPGESAMGMPTAHSGPVLRDVLAAETAFVWPSSGPDEVPGRAIAPLHASAIPASRAWPDTYTLLSLCDAMRVGRVRERAIAERAIEQLVRG